MSVTREYGKVILICDGCADSLETQTRDFHEAMGVVRQEGWTMRSNKGGVYKHYCSTCDNEEGARR